MPGSQLRVELIEGLTALDGLRSAWEAVYEQDDCAHVFCSWPWTRGFFQTAHGRPLVLALNDVESDRFVAFLALFGSPAKRGGVLALRRLNISGTGLADYTGLISLPAYCEAAVTHFAGYLRRMPAWDELFFEDVFDDRVQRIVGLLDGAGVRVTPLHRNRCPYVVLPDSWDALLQASLTRQRRYELKRRMRQLATLPGFRATTATAATLDEHAAAVIGMWAAKWGKDAAARKKRLLPILQRCLAADLLWLSVYWSGAEPVAGVIAFTDKRRNAFRLYMTSFNAKYATISPGRAALGYCIQYAIEQRFAIFDTLRGDEPYKSELCRAEHSTTTTVVQRASLRRTFRGAASKALQPRRTVSQISSRIVSKSSVFIFRGRLLAGAQQAEGYRIRRFDAQDFEALDDRETLSELGLNADLCRQRWARGDVCFMAWRSGRALGAVWYARGPVFTAEIARSVSPLPGDAYVYHLQVIPSMRGRRIGPALLHHVAAELKAAGVYRTWWAILASNQNSLRAFAKAADSTSQPDMLCVKVTYVRTPFKELLLVPSRNKAVRDFLLAATTSPEQPQLLSYPASGSVIKTLSAALAYRAQLVKAKLSRALGRELHLHTVAREVLENVILSAFSARADLRRVVFVGTAPYTEHYDKYFAHAEYWTIDKEPESAKYGAARHICDRIENLGRYFQPDTLDLVICNGVFGWGLNERQDAEEAFSACYTCLAPGGVMVLGWNDVPLHRPFHPQETRALGRFERYAFEPLHTSHYVCAGESHVYDFYRKPVAQPQATAPARSSARS